MPRRAAITGHALAEATARPSAERGGSQYLPSIPDHEIGKQRALQTARARRHYPAGHAAKLACSQLAPLSAAHRTGVVIATSAADRQDVARIPDAFLTPHAARSSRDRLDVLVAVSRFLPGALAQAVAAMLGTRGPEVCLPGDCGLAPLAVASLFIETGRADAMVVVAVDPPPGDSARYQAVAVLLEQPTATGRAIPPPSAGALTTDNAACVTAIKQYLSHLLATHDDGTGGPGAPCEISWAGRSAPGPADPGQWLDDGRTLLDECLRAAGTRDLGLVTASFLDLSPEHALDAVEHGAEADEIAREARRTTFEDGLRRHAIDRALRGPYVGVTGIPGASLLALAIAEDLIRQAAVPSVAVIAGDWMGDGAARALTVLGCPDRLHMRSSVSALLLERATHRSAARRVRTLIARRDACDEFAGELRAHAPSHTLASGCTGADVDAARHFLSSCAPRRCLQHADRRERRFLGADAAECLADLLDLPGRAALSVRNDLGGSGVVLLDRSSG
jgi:hypothetical protein